MPKESTMPRRSTPEQKSNRIFHGDPRRVSEYLGQLTRISVMLNEPAEAAARARLAVKFAKKAMKRGSR